MSARSMPTGAPADVRALLGRYTEAQRRTASVALELFADHGVGGTSLQMIADRLGVTKAAVYHQFATKDAIVVAVLETELARLEHAVGPLVERLAEDPSTATREELLAAVIDNVVANRRALHTLQHDPVLARLLESHDPARRFFAELFAALVGAGQQPADRVRAAVLSAAIGSVGHPFVVELDDDTLRAELLRLARPLLGPAGAARGPRGDPPRTPRPPGGRL